MSEFLSTIVLVVVMWFGGQLVLSGESALNAQEFIGYILIFSQIIPPAKSLTTAYYRIQKGSAAAQRVYEIKDLNLKKLIKIDVNFKQVGSDRITNAISLINEKNNFIILDFGTATTFDVIIKNTYYGGVIAPGISLSLNTLIKKATLIPMINLSKISRVVGRNTNQAVRSGFYWGYIGLIDNIILMIKKQTKKSFKLIFTGGLAHMFKNLKKNKALIQKDLTIDGLIKIIKNT